MNIPAFQVKVKKPSWGAGSVFQIKRKVVNKNGELPLPGSMFVYLSCAIVS